MRVNISSRTLVILLFLAIVAVSHATLFWMPVWKQTTVLRYHPKKGWYPVKHASSVGAVARPKKLPSLSNILKNAEKHLAKGPLPHRPISHSHISVKHRHKVWKPKPFKPLIGRRPQYHETPHWKPSKPSGPKKLKRIKPASAPTPTQLKPRPKPRTKLKAKRRPKSRPKPKQVPNFNLETPPFHENLFSPKPHNRPPRPPRRRPKKTNFNKYNPFHKIITSHFTPIRQVNSFSPPKPKPRPKGPPRSRAPRKKRPPPPKKGPKGKTRYNFEDFYGLKPPPPPKDFHSGPSFSTFNFNNFPSMTPQISTFFKDFGDFPKSQKGNKGRPQPDFLSAPQFGTFDFDFSKSNDDPPRVPKYLRGSLGGYYPSPRVPRLRNPFSGFNKFTRFSQIKHSPIANSHVSSFSNFDNFPLYNPPDNSPNVVIPLLPVDDSPTNPQNDEFIKIEEFPKRNNLKTVGQLSQPFSFPKEFSTFGKGFDFYTGFASGKRGKGWGRWVW